MLIAVADVSPAIASVGERRLMERVDLRTRAQSVGHGPKEAAVVRLVSVAGLKHTAARVVSLDHVDGGSWVTRSGLQSLEAPKAPRL